FAQPYETGIASSRASPVHTEIKGRQIVFSAGLFFLISGQNTSTPSLGGKCVTTINGMEFSDPVSHGVGGAMSIAASDLTTSMVPIPDSPGFYIDSRTGEIVGPPG